MGSLLLYSNIQLGIEEMIWGDSSGGEQETSIVDWQEF